MAGSKKFTTIKSRAIRITRLDDCGAPVIGARTTIVHQGGFTKVDSKLDVQAAEEFLQQDAWGDFCVNERDKPKIKGADVTTEFCNVDPDSYELVGGARALPATADDGFAAVGVNVGYGIGVDTVSGDFALEAWTRVGGGACQDGDPLWVWTIWPWMTGGVPGDLTLERGTATFPLITRAQGASAAWGAGPYDTSVVDVDAGEVYLQRLTIIQPPDATNGAVALAAP